MLSAIHLISSLSRGGRERQLAGILNKTHDKAIVFNKTANNYVEEYNLTEKLFYLKSKNPVSRFFQMLRIIKNEKPDFIWSWGGFEATFGLLISLITSTHHINGSIRHGIVLCNRKQLWRMFILHLSRHIVANSHAGLKANKLKRGHVLYNGLDDRFYESVNKEAFLSENPDIKRIKDRNLPVLISVANLVPYKDYFTVLKALEMIKKDGFGFSYFIIGEGPNRQAIEKQISDKGLQDDVFLLGRREHLKELLSIADIFIHSSKGEGCSNAVLEAMAAGLPVIATDTGGTKELVSEDVGFLFPYENNEILKDILKKCLGDISTVRAIGKNALEKAKRAFSIDRMMENYYQIIDKFKSN